MEQKERYSNAFRSFVDGLKGKYSTAEGGLAVTEIGRAGRLGAFLWRLFVHNAGLKAIALLFSVLLWSYIVTDTDPIVRKIYTNIPISIVGTDNMRKNGYCLKDDVKELDIQNGTVQVDISFNASLNISATDINIICDLSQVNSDGEVMVKLNATSKFGDVVSINPSVLKFDVDEYMEKEIPISCELKNDLPDDKTIEMPTLSRNTVKIGGPKSYIENVASGNVEINLENVNETMFPCSLPYTLLNLDNVSMTVPNLVYDERAVTVFMTVYSKKTVQIDLTSRLGNYDKTAEGYAVEKISCYPKYVTIVGNSVELAEISSITLMQFIDMNGADADITGSYKLSIPEGIKVMDDISEAYVSIEIAEQKVHKEFNELLLVIYGSGENKTEADVENFKFAADVPYFYAKEMTAENVTLYVEIDPEHKIGETKAYTVKYAILGKEAEPDFVKNVTIETAQVNITLLSVEDLGGETDETPVEP